MSVSVAGCSFGATLLGAGRTRFRLWAPACQSVTLEIEGRAPLRMTPAEPGWFELEADAGSGARYRYRVSDDLAVPDPASRFQPDDVHGASEVIDPLAYQWQHPRWCGRPWTETVIYELHVGLCGGYDGVAARLPALAALGITAIELMPVADFPGHRNWGYDGVLPYAPEASYGRPEQLKALIDSAHGLGLMVFLDVVYNHFGPDGNYLNAYAPQFFDEQLHTPWGAAIDFSRREVRDYYIGNARMWLQEYRFDGLRFDAVHAITDDSFLDELAQQLRAAVEPGRHVHLMLENEHNNARLLEDGRYTAQWNDDGHNALHVLLTGETDSYYRNYAEAPAQQLARVLREGFAYQGEPSPSHGGAPRGTPSALLPTSAFILFLQNHDQIGNRAFGERLSLLADADALRAASALQLLSPQIPLLFMGEEWGSRAPFLFFTDFNDELADAVRVGRRQEFAAFAAFSDEATRARIPDPNAFETWAQSVADPDEAQRSRHADVLAWYGELLRLRHRYLVPRLPGTRSEEAVAIGPCAVLACWRLGDGSLLHIAANFGAGAEGISPGHRRPAGRLLVETRTGAAMSLASGCLPARSACVYVEEVM